jgi:hypothetical protein
MQHIHGGLEEHFARVGQAVVDQLQGEMAGRPADEVAPLLLSRMRAKGIKVPEATLRGWAESIAAGTDLTVVVKVDGVPAGT